MQLIASGVLPELRCLPVTQGAVAKSAFTGCAISALSHPGRPCHNIPLQHREELQYSRTVTAHGVWEDRRMVRRHKISPHLERLGRYSLGLREFDNAGAHDMLGSCQLIR